MKKKKGFTIIELIVSITILTIIVLVVGVNFNKIFDNREKQSYDEYVNKIKSATDLYLSNNITLTSELNTNKSYVRISLKELKESGLIGEDLKNPVSGSIPDDKELVLVSLDETGAYKFTYPSVEVEAHLQTLNKIVDYNSTFDCLADLDTINLGLVDKDGNLVKDYFKNNPSNITCKTSSIDTKSIGNQVVKYSYILDGVTKEATRNYVVIDSIYPTVTNISQNPTAWTKNTVTITANINDYESGIAAYAINLNKCGNLVSTTNNQITSVVSQNGTYSVCAKDIYGNVKEEKINITNIDKTAPTVQISKSTNNYVTSLTITGTLSDSESRVTAYAINQTSTASSVSWTNISATTSRTVSSTVTANGTYYIWARDAVGNVSNQKITINNIGILKKVTFTTGELSSRTHNGQYNTGAQVKAIQSVSTNTGSVSASSFSGTTVSYTLQSGSSYTGYDTRSCTYSATRRSADYDKYCSKYSCPSGGSLSGSRCTGSNGSTKPGVNKYECRNGRWASTFNSNYVQCNDKGYKKEWGCGSAPSGSCEDGKTRNVACWGRCVWRGNYNATCTSYSGSYSCPSGYKRSGSNCYKCDSGDTLDGTTCHSTCTYSYTYYRYTVTIEYLI